jgi:hypothetical protein
VGNFKRGSNAVIFTSLNRYFTPALNSMGSGLTLPFNSTWLFSRCCDPCSHHSSEAPCLWSHQTFSRLQNDDRSIHAGKQLKVVRMGMINKVPRAAEPGAPRMNLQAARAAQVPSSISPTGNTVEKTFYFKTMPVNCRHLMELVDNLNGDGLISR